MRKLLIRLASWYLKKHSCITLDIKDMVYFNNTLFKLVAYKHTNDLINGEMLSAEFKELSVLMKDNKIKPDLNYK